ncbi:MAG TPA: PEGA domain-containing protein, partial [Polyangiaceae bacterium]|nr:PEGA domain-containing protein [Polyangiaceae bacterium]
PAALRWYRDYLRRSPAAANAAEVQARVHDLALQLEARGVQQLSVLIEPPGARLSIDERVVGVAPFTTELPPGAHHLSVRAAGYRDVEQDFELDARTPRDLSLKLEPQTDAAISPVAAPLPHASSPPPPAPATAAAPVAANQAKPFGVVPWIVLGAGAASTLAALGFELSRRSAESDAKNSIQLDYPERYDAMHGRQTTARVLAVLGGGLLATGGVLFVLNTPKKSAPKLALACGGSGCSLAASGSFR